MQFPARWTGAGLLGAVMDLVLLHVVLLHKCGKDIVPNQHLYMEEIPVGDREKSPEVAKKILALWMVNGNLGHHGPVVLPLVDLYLPHKQGQDLAPNHYIEENIVMVQVTNPETAIIGHAPWTGVGLLGVVTDFALHRASCDQPTYRAARFAPAKNT